MIRFVFDDKAVVARTQTIGSVATLSNSFMWAPANASVDAAHTVHARVTREIIEQLNGPEMFQLDTVHCDDADETTLLAWDITALAAFCTGAAGTYRCPNGSTSAFFITFGDPLILDVASWDAERLAAECELQGIAADGTADDLRSRFLDACGDPGRSWNVPFDVLPPFRLTTPFGDDSDADSDADPDADPDRDADPDAHAHADAHARAP